MPSTSYRGPRQSPAERKREIAQLWQKIDRNNDGEATLQEILKASSLLQESCPEFLKNLSQLAQKGVVTRQQFLDFCMNPQKVLAGVGGSTSINVSAPMNSARGRGPSTSNTSADSKRLSVEELEQFFQRVCSPDSGTIRLEEIVHHRDEIQKTFPALIERFAEIDLDGTNVITWEELRVFHGGAADWLEYQFNEIVGLEPLKQQIRKFHRALVLDQRRRQNGFKVSGEQKYHMIFQGNPGTGKTTVGRLIAKLLRKIGVLQSDLLLEVQRDKLVAEYVGQTAPKTQKVMEEAKGGILFIDEAYRLSAGSGRGSDFGREAIETLMGAMNERPGEAPVMVFAGYPDDMQQFMNANSGLYRRIAYTFDFTDYSPQEIGIILDKYTKSKGFRLEDKLVSVGGATSENANESGALSRLGELIEEHTTEEARSLLNGGLAERLFTFAKQSLDAREAGKMSSGLDASRAAAPSVVILEEDVASAFARIPPPPPRNGSRAPSGAGCNDGPPTSGSGGSGSSGDNDVLVSWLQKENADLKRQLAEGRAELTKEKQNLGLVQNQLAACKTEAGLTKRDLQLARNALAEAERKNKGGPASTSTVAVDVLSGDGIKINQQSNALQDRCAQLADENTGLLQKNDALLVENEQLRSDLAAVRVQLDGCRREIEMLRGAGLGGGGGGVAAGGGHQQTSISSADAANGRPDSIVILRKDKPLILPCLSYSGFCMFWWISFVLSEIARWSAWLWRTHLRPGLKKCFRFLADQVNGTRRSSGESRPGDRTEDAAVAPTCGKTDGAWLAKKDPDESNV